MPLLKILKYGHPLLRAKASDLKSVGPREHGLMADMAETMYAARGIGLASTQVGWMERLFVIDVDQRRAPAADAGDAGGADDAEDEDDEGDDDDDDADLAIEESTAGDAPRVNALVAANAAPGLVRRVRVFVNPTVTAESEDDAPFKEGCLSIPGVEGTVYRPERLKIAAFDENLQPFEAEIGGLLARVFLHELDHLEGQLFVDKLPRLKRSLVAGALNRIKKDAAEVAAADPAGYPTPAR